VKLAIFGLSVSSAWGNGHATVWRGILRSLGRLGHEATFFERDTPYYAKHRDMPAGDGYSVVVYPSWEEIERRARRAVSESDVAIVTSYCADAKPASELVRASKSRRVYYDLDTPVTLEMLDRGQDVPYLPDGGLSGFDLALSYTGGEALDALRTRLGARRAEPLYGSVDADTHRPDDGCAAARACDLSYLGTYAADRQAGVEALFLEVARRLPERRFVLGGPMYPEDMRRPDNVTWLPHVPPAEHRAFYGSSRLTLNVTRGAMARMGWCPSARLFEAAACGVPIVSDSFTGLGAFFMPGFDIVVAKDTDDVVEALALPDDELAAMARRARARTLGEHSAKRRAEQLLDLVQSI
jgi:spore maturation protein CgeB